MRGEFDVGKRNTWHFGCPLCAARPRRDGKLLTAGCQSFKKEDPDLMNIRKVLRRRGQR